MKGQQIILGRYEGTEIAALMRNGKLHDLFIEAPGSICTPGAIYRGIVDRPLKGQGAMIVRLPDGQTGFLRETKGLRPGDPLLVQVTGVSEPDKAVPLTSRVLFKSRYCIVTPGAPGENISRSIHDEVRRAELRALLSDLPETDQYGLILRSACEMAPDDAIADDLRHTTNVARQVMDDAGREPELLLDGPSPELLAWREWTEEDAPILLADTTADLSPVADAIASLRQPFVPLAANASMYIEETRAFVAVDVNTGADGSAAAGLRANIAAVRSLASELRLRGLGGQIVIDFAPMPKKERKRFEQTMRAAFRAGLVETNLVGWTTLGHFELQRKRERIPLSICLP
ncbi:ribonuclease E/G [Qingshengfaniella alkalisoli]|uniref:Ribonuclease G n=1 Tax=Qingshengfaniella alkalisoli TaxID=2599296 RepID=A0A5B8I4Y3_9RHOB|nr:ribonuclease E/G [Qingshengfaniella alkalisoli]QDY68245.1 ribonuclease G [Qingshengfaniella alkalisoli]